MSLLRTLLLVFAIASTGFGCAVYPTTRTYFEPNPIDGEPVPSMSCGYHRASNDSLKREIDGVQIVVTPRYQDDADLAVAISLQYQEGVLTNDPEQFELRSPRTIQAIKAKVSQANAYNADQTHPRREFVHIRFPIKASLLKHIEIVMPPESILRNGKPMHLAPFRFQKVQKNDVYYASINC